LRSGDPDATGFHATLAGRPGEHAMIAIEHLSKRFSVGRGRSARVVDAVRKVALVANDACITGLLGSNGAGKTTTLRMVAGLITPDSGKVEVDGINVAERPAAALARMGVLSDSRGLYPRLSARENIIYYGRLHGLSARGADSRAEELAHMFDMTALLDRRSEGFSQGERMKTALARALVHDPPNIVLDEPTNGLDVLATRGLRDCLRRLRDDQGKCIIFSTHIMQEVEKLCDRVVIVAEGRTVANGTVADLRQQTGTVDFEECFVKLAFGANADRLPRPDADGSRS
jgi:sodium transport system ATP-binding protein